MIVIAGHFGRGNAGDEAFVHALYDTYRNEFNIAIIVEQHHAEPGFETWHPYNKCEIINYDSVDRMYGDDIAGLHLGGGSLPFGFCGQFVISALDAGKPVVWGGVDAAIKPNAPTHNIRRVLMPRFAAVSVRTTRAYENLVQNEVSVTLGADWATALRIAPEANKKRMVYITCRGFGKIDKQHREDVKTLLASLDAQDLNWEFMPFAPEDDQFLEAIGDDIVQGKISRCWHDPKECIRRISTATAMISIGRLHALIFSMISGTKVFAVDPRIMANGRHIHNRKNKFFCAEHGLDFFEDYAAAIDAINGGYIDRLNYVDFPDDYTERLATQIRVVGDAFRGTSSAEEVASVAPGEDTSNAAKRKLKRLQRRLNKST